MFVGFVLLSLSLEGMIDITGANSNGRGGFANCELLYLKEIKENNRNKININ